MLVNKATFQTQHIDTNKWCNITYTVTHGRFRQVLTRRDQIKLKETMNKEKDEKKKAKSKGETGSDGDGTAEGSQVAKRKRETKKDGEKKVEPKSKAKSKAKAASKAASKANPKAKSKKVLKEDEKSDGESEEMVTPKRRLFQEDSSEENEEREPFLTKLPDPKTGLEQQEAPSESEEAAAVPKKRAKAKAQPKQKAKAKAKAKSKVAEKRSPNTKVTSPSIKKEQKRRKKATEDYQCESAEDMKDQLMQELFRSHLKQTHCLNIKDLKAYLQTHMPNSNKHGCKVAYWSRATASVGVSVYMDLENPSQSKAHCGYFSFKLAKEWSSNICCAYVAAHLMVSGLKGFVGGVIWVQLDQTCC